MQGLYSKRIQKAPPLSFFFLQSMLLAKGSWSNSWQSGFLLGQNEM